MLTGPGSKIIKNITINRANIKSARRAPLLQGTLLWYALRGAPAFMTSSRATVQCQWRELWREKERERAKDDRKLLFMVERSYQRIISIGARAQAHTHTPAAQPVFYLF